MGTENFIYVYYESIKREPMKCLEFKKKQWRKKKVTERRKMLKKSGKNRTKAKEKLA
jgi:hypothetical protein